MRTESCPYEAMNTAQLDELLQMTVWSLNEIGLRKLVMSFLSAMTQACATGCALDAALAERPTDPIVTEVLHLHRHAMAKRVEQEQGRHLRAVAN